MSDTMSSNEPLQDMRPFEKLIEVARNLSCLIQSLQEENKQRFQECHDELVDQLSVKSVD